MDTVGWIVIALGILGAFWAVVLLADRKYNLKKLGLAISPGLIMWRTKRGLHFIDRVSRDKRCWRIYGSVAVAFGIVLMVFVSFNLILNIIYVLTHPSAVVPGVQLVLPGIVPGLSPLSWLVAIFSVLLVHEFSHGFLLRAQNLKTKSVGGLLLIAIPGAFVEPNEKQLERAPVIKRLRVFSAGAFSNVVFAVLCLGILLLLIVPKPGAYVFGVGENSPASGINITPGMRIYSINNFAINNPDDFESFMERTTPRENVRVIFSGGDKTVSLTTNPNYENRGFLGLLLGSAISRWNFVNPLFVLGTSVAELLGGNVFHPYLYDALVPWSVMDIIKWMFVLNLGIGLFNLLPMIPLDGGYVLRGLLEKILSKERAVAVTRVVSIIILALILANFFQFLR